MAARKILFPLNKKIVVSGNSPSYCYKKRGIVVQDGKIRPGKSLCGQCDWLDSRSSLPQHHQVVDRKLLLFIISSWRYRSITIVVLFSHPLVLLLLHPPTLLIHDPMTFPLFSWLISSSPTSPPVYHNTTRFSLPLAILQSPVSFISY